jgi:hypothetical protein
VKIAAPECGGVPPSKCIESAHSRPHRIDQRDGRPETLIVYRNAECRADFLGELSKHVCSVLPGAVGVENDRQHHVGMKRQSRIEPPNIGKTLNRVTGVWKHRAVQELQATGEDIFKRTSNQGAAVSLQVGISLVDGRARPEQSHTQGTGGGNDLFGRVAAEVTEDRTLVVCFPRPRVGIRVRRDVCQSFNNRHASILSTDRPQSSSLSRCAGKGPYPTFPWHQQRNVVILKADGEIN